MKLLVTFAIFAIASSLAILSTSFVTDNVSSALPARCTGNIHGAGCIMTNDPKGSYAEWAAVHHGDVIN